MYVDWLPFSKGWTRLLDYVLWRRGGYGCVESKIVCRKCVSLVEVPRRVFRLSSNDTYLWNLAIRRGSCNRLWTVLKMVLLLLTSLAFSCVYLARLVVVSAGWLLLYVGRTMRIVVPYLIRLILLIQVDKGYLAGFIPGIEANQLLEKEPPGTFLIRHSKSHADVTRLSYVDTRLAITCSLPRRLR